MIIGSTVFCPDDTGVILHSPWFERQADVAKFFAQVLAVNGGKIRVRIQDKDVGDVDPAENANIVDYFDADTVGDPAAVIAVGLRQLVRFEYKFYTEGDPGWIHFVMLPPIWIPN